VSIGVNFAFLRTGRFCFFARSFAAILLVSAFDESPDDAQVLADIIAALRRLSPESRRKVLGYPFARKTSVGSLKNSGLLAT